MFSDNPQDYRVQIWTSHVRISDSLEASFVSLP